MACGYLISILIRAKISSSNDKSL
jgi:hypothetical protein